MHITGGFFFATTIAVSKWSISTFWKIFITKRQFSLSNIFHFSLGRNTLIAISTAYTTIVHHHYLAINSFCFPLSFSLFLTSVHSHTAENDTSTKQNAHKMFIRLHDNAIAALTMNVLQRLRFVAKIRKQKKTNKLFQKYDTRVS